jgi:[ribosomal protein S5]-alanine N-acetyltransferase
MVRHLLLFFPRAAEGENMSVILETGRLLLRPSQAADISHFLPLLREFEVARNLSVVPHPYTEDHACAFIVHAAHGWASGEDSAFAILRKVPAAYIGCCGVHPARNWEFGYWLGKPIWGQGCATEAVGRLVEFAFEELNAERLTAGWFHDNPASGRVLEKLGCVPDGEEERSCHSRGCDVFCHKVVLKRADYRPRKECQ